MKTCYDNKLLWIAIFALLVFIITSLQPYHYEKFVVDAGELDGEDRNNYDCAKLMENNIYFKDKYQSLNDNAKTIVSMMQPGLSEQYKETGTEKYMKSMCIIPKCKMDLFSFKLEQDPIKGGESKQCRATTKDGKVEVIMPYVSDVTSGCALKFNDYAQQPEKVEILLNNLVKISDESNQKIKDNSINLRNVRQNEVNTLNEHNDNLQAEKNSYFDKNQQQVNQINELLPKVNDVETKYNDLQKQKQSLTDSLNTNWF